MKKLLGVIVLCCVVSGCVQKAKDEPPTDSVRVAEEMIPEGTYWKVILEYKRPSFGNAELDGSIYISGVGLFDFTDASDLRKRLAMFYGPPEDCTAACKQR